MELILALPVTVALHLDPDLPGMQSAALAELIACSGQLLLSENDLEAFHITVFDNPSEHPLVGSHWIHPGNIRRYKLLLLSVDGRISIEQTKARFEVSETQELRHDPELFAIDSVLTDLEMQANNLLLLTNLLRPGAVSVTEGFAFCDRELVRRTESFYTDHLYSAIEAASVANWPPFQEITLHQAWTWLEYSGCIVDGIGTGPLGRAMAALSHLAKNSTNESGSIDLAWIMLGLEALYAKGAVGLQEQLVVKTEVLLGKKKGHKKAFGQAYGFRSRFLHGDIDLPFRYTPYNAVSKYEGFYDDLHRSEALALAVLIATLQLMILSSWTELSFTYSASGTRLNSETLP